MFEYAGNWNDDAPSASAPVAIPESFTRALRGECSDFETASAVRLIYYELAGASLTDRNRKRARQVLTDHAMVGSLEAAGALYNSLLRSVARPRSRAHIVHAKKIRHQLENLSAVTTVAIAQRFPVVLDPHFEGEIRHRDKYGDVYCSHPLRPVDKALVGAIGGIFKNRAYYEKHGFVDAAGDVFLSERKLYWMLGSDNEGGGAGLAWIRESLSRLNAAHMWAHEDVRLENARDRGFASSPIEAIYRLVDAGAAGAIWADIDDDRATANGHGATIRFVLAPWFARQLGSDNKNKVIFTLASWKRLSPGAANLMIVLAGERAQKIIHGTRTFTGIHIFAGKELCHMVGLRAARRYAECRDSLYTWMLEIRDELERYEWISEPYRRFKSSHYYDFVLRIAPGGSSKRRAAVVVSGPASAGGHGRYSKGWLRRRRAEVKSLAQAAANSPPL